MTRRCEARVTCGEVCGLYVVQRCESERWRYLATVTKLGFALIRQLAVFLPSVRSFFSGTLRYLPAYPLAVSCFPRMSDISGGPSKTSTSCLTQSWPGRTRIHIFLSYPYLGGGVIQWSCKKRHQEDRQLLQTISNLHCNECSQKYKKKKTDDITITVLNSSK